MTRLICLRDDDTSFHTKYEELADGYGEFWGKLPVTLATVPFSHGSQQKILEVEFPPEKKYQRVREWELNATADELTEYHKLHPIGENKELVDKLKPLIKAKKVEIAQHGISHRYNEKGAEMFYDNVGLLQIRDGKEHLEKVFDTEVKVFVPPSNSIDTRCAIYLKKIGLEILSCGSLKYRNQIQKVSDLISNPLDILTFLEKRFIKSKVSPSIYCKRGITITTSFTFNDFNSLDEMLNKVKNLLKYNQTVSITTHYMLLNNLSNGIYEYRKKYQEFLSRICELKDVEFVTATEYIKKLKEERY